MLRAFLRLYPFYPAVALTRLNDYYCEAQSLDDRFTDSLIAISLAVINSTTGEASIAWAGSEPPLILRANGIVEALQGGGMLIGVRQHGTFAELTTSLRAGDTLLLSTDGLSEARHGNEFLGQEGVIALFAQAKGQSVRQIGESLLTGARQFSNGPLHDDACLVLVQPK